jgi:hypothetical protein
MVWGIPAVGAAIIMILFALTFRDTAAQDQADAENVAKAQGADKNP